MPETTVINFSEGDTEITNNTIVSGSLSGPDIYCNNIYRYSGSSDIVVHNDITVPDLTATTINTNTLAPNTGATVTAAALEVTALVAGSITPQDTPLLLDGNTLIQGNLTVTGTQTALNSVQTNILDNYIYLGSGQYVNGNYSGGVIINRSPSATVFTLSGNFVAGSALIDPTVETVAASGLNPGDIVQISNSTSNDSIFEVLSHTGNVLTVKGGFTPLDDKFCSNQFNAEAAAGRVQVVAISGFECDDDGTTINYLNGSSAPVSRNAIAYDSSSPNFNDVSVDTLTIGTVSNDDTQLKLLVLDDDNLVKYRTVSSIASDAVSLTGTTSMIVPTFSGCGLSSEDYGQLIIRKDPLGGENYQIQLGSFEVTTILSGAAIYLDLAATDYISALHMFHPILLNVDGLHEECYIVDDFANTRFAIVRKDGSSFAAGIVVRVGSDNFGSLGFPLVNSWNFKKY